jgi:hypothetical protein
MIERAPAPRSIKNGRMNRRPRRAAMAILLAIAGAGHAQKLPLPDPQAFLVESLNHLRSNDLVRSGYTYQEQETRYSYGPDGRVTQTRVRIYEVEPSPEPELTYRRLVSEDGVQPKDLAKRDAEQRRKEREWLARRELEGLDERQARERKREIEEMKEQTVVGELPSIFDIRMTGRDTIDGRPAIVFTFEPRPAYSPRTPEGRILNHFRGQAWIDERDHELARLYVDCLDNVSVKWGFIFRLSKGSRGRIERRKIDEDGWLPTYSRFTGSGRVFFIARVDLDQESVYSSYRKREGGR